MALTYCLDCGLSVDDSAGKCPRCSRVIEPVRVQGPPLAPEERKARLDAATQQWIAQGLRLESRSDYSAVFVLGKPVNHLLHFFVGL